LLHLQGEDDALWFKEGRVDMGTLQNQIKQLNIDSKLRMVYSTACFGITHADNFVKAGFAAASGSKKVNANSPAEYPMFLSLWVAGFKFSDCINMAENRGVSIVTDAALNALFQDLGGVNSDKHIKGVGNITIDS
jgi:hypothetical protein